MLYLPTNIDVCLENGLVERKVYIVSGISIYPDGLLLHTIHYAVYINKYKLILCPSSWMAKNVLHSSSFFSASYYVEMEMKERKYGAIYTNKYAEETCLYDAVDDGDLDNEQQQENL